MSKCESSSSAGNQTKWYLHKRLIVWLSDQLVFRPFDFQIEPTQPNQTSHKIEVNI